MLSLYIHIPFCKQKCYYCDFCSYPGQENVFGSYINALKNEIKLYSKLMEWPQIKTIYIGGGTPTILDSAQIEEIIISINDNFSVVNNAEISIEANPETLTRAKLYALKEIGINRLSIGFQSFDDQLLKILGRKHTARNSIGSFLLAREAGFDNINIDLIFGLPEQSIANWALSLEQAIALNPEHLSCYSLTIENGTVLKSRVSSGLLAKPDDDLAADMYLYAIESLIESGYSHYEISNFARKGKVCLHNLSYWENKDYLGIGASAHSKIGNKRFCNVKNPSEYIKASIAALKNFSPNALVENQQTLSQEDILSEIFFLGLRKIDGINLQEIDYFRPFLAKIKGKGESKKDALQDGLCKETLQVKDNKAYSKRLSEEDKDKDKDKAKKADGINKTNKISGINENLLERFTDEIIGLINEGLLELDQEKLRLTKHGLLLGNEVFSRFV